MVSHLNRTPEVVRGCRFRHGVACNVLCIMGVAHRVVWCDDGLPPPPGWHFVGGVGGPRMSPTPRSAKYGATHSGNPSRGGGNARLWSSSPLLAEWADASHSMHSALVLDDDGGVLCFAAPGFALLWLRFGGAWGIVGTKKSMPKHRFQINPKT